MRKVPEAASLSTTSGRTVLGWEWEWSSEGLSFTSKENSLQPLKGVFYWKEKVT
jgi:hypothetical protein